MPEWTSQLEAKHALRVADLGDLDRIEAIIGAAYEAHLTRMGFPPVQLLRDHSDAIEAGQVWVLGDPILGAITLIDADDTMLVENLVVDPSVQGTGLGRRLMWFAEEIAVREGLQRVALHYNDVNIQHQDFFMHLGYNAVSRRTQHGLKRAFMEKRVGG